MADEALLSLQRAMIRVRRTIRRRHRRPAPPILLDPILRLWEQADRRRRHIRPIRRHGVLGVEFSRYRGPLIALADGTSVRAGDSVGLLHLENKRAPELAGPAWQTRGFYEARLDLQALAAWSVRQSTDGRPVAYMGATLVAPLARRIGFEVRARPRTWRSRLDDWFMRWLMARWSPSGRGRLHRGHGLLRSREAWLSDRSLHRFYGSRPAGHAAALAADAASLA